MEVAEVVMATGGGAVALGLLGLMILPLIGGEVALGGLWWLIVIGFVCLIIGAFGIDLP